MGAEHVPLSPRTLPPTVKLQRSGLQLPRLGFGVYQSKQPLASTAGALAMGYRHIDSARAYFNEEAVCQAVSKFLQTGQPSSSNQDTTGTEVNNSGNGPVWLTTKVMGKEHGTEETRRAVEESMKVAGEFGLKWDLYLLHDPTAGRTKRIEAWKALIEARDAGKIKAIGVSNFSEKHLEELKSEGLETPDVNQIELHPFCQQKPIVEYCKKEGIVVEAYCPIMRGQKYDTPALVKLCEKHSATPAQILLRWSLQKGFVPLPKSDTLHRIEENKDLEGFELDEGDMRELDGLDQGREGAVSWNPVDHE
ncbi:hypothetical protein JCM10213_005856 [Rhodosporidiobolus nylandii]